MLDQLINLLEIEHQLGTVWVDKYAISITETEED
jgi:hypothetical protein